MHRDRRGGSCVDRARGPVLGDRQHLTHAFTSLRRQAFPLLPEEKDARLGQVGRLEGNRAREIVDPDHRDSLGRCPRRERLGVFVVAHVLVAVGDHRTASIPALAPNNVHLTCQKGVGGAHDGSDVEVVGEVLNRHVEGVSATIQILNDRLEPPVPVLVDDVASITPFEQLRIKPRIVGPRMRVRADAHRHGFRAVSHVCTCVTAHPGDDSRYGSSVKRAIVNLVRGLLMGVAEVIPGVSGGTVALIVGVYRTLINAIADAVLALRQLVGLAQGGPSAGRFSGTLKSLPWGLLIPLAIGMGVAVILGAKFIEPLLETNPIQMKALFFGLVLAGVYVPAHMVIRAGGPWRTVDYVVALVFAIILFVLVGLPPATIDDPSPLVIFLSAAVAICALVLPGVSGSFLLLTLGMYESTIAAVNDRNIAYLAVFALGAIVGLALFVSVLKWLLAHRTRITLVVITGLMVGSLRALWPWEDDDRGLLAPSTDVLSAIVLFLVGMAIVVALILTERRLGLSEEQEDAGLASP